jgi:hypothetical protein
MFRTTLSARRILIAAVLIGVLFALGVVVSRAVAAPSCKHMSGEVVIDPVVTGTCTSPYGICVSRTYRGPFKATSAFTGTSLISTIDTPVTNVLVLTADNVIQTSGGTLYTRIATVIESTGNGDFSEVETIIAGTGDWLGATGAIRTTGTQMGGSGTGQYTAEICLP